jgi:hypothetical protein
MFGGPTPAPASVLKSWRIIQKSHTIFCCTIKIKKLCLMSLRIMVNTDVVFSDQSRSTLKKKIATTRHQLSGARAGDVPPWHHILTTQTIAACQKPSQNRFVKTQEGVSFV